MEDDYENTTTDEAPHDDILNDGKTKVVIDIKPRKVPKAIIEAQLTKLALLKKNVHSMRLENEALKAENLAMKKNIERYYELVYQARERKKIKGNQNASAYTITTGILLGCTMHYNSYTDGEITLGRRLLFFDIDQYSLFMVYAMILIGFLIFSLIRKYKYKLLTSI